MKSVAPESRDLQVALLWNSWRHNQGHDNALFVIERRCINSSFFNRLLSHCNTLTALESSKFIMLKGKNVGGFTLTVNFICPLVLIFTEKALLFLNFTPSNSLLTKNISLMKKNVSIRFAMSMSLDQVGFRCLDVGKIHTYTLICTYHLILWYR